MTPPFKLTPRLLLCAKFVRSGINVCDVGTDHAYLPIYLAYIGKAKSALACDINEGPLERGKQNIEKYGVINNVKTRLSDGLLNVSEKEADDIIIAGMGGELIVKIISEAPWLKSNDKRLILQPMTRSEVLREYLFDNGFVIDKEECVLSEKRIYSVMFVKYVGDKTAFSKREKYLGKLIKEDNPSLYEMYLDKVKSALIKKADGFKVSGNMNEADNILEIINELEC